MNRITTICRTAAFVVAGVLLTSCAAASSTSTTSATPTTTATITSASAAPSTTATRPAINVAGSRCPELMATIVQVLDGTEQGLTVERQDVAAYTAGDTTAIAAATSRMETLSDEVEAATNLAMQQAGSCRDEPTAHGITTVLRAGNAAMQSMDAQTQAIIKHGDVAGTTATADDDYRIFEDAYSSFAAAHTG